MNRDVPVISAVLLVTAAFLCVKARWYYDFFDHSAFMDAGYRIACGQQPYRDFIFNAGPVHLYLEALFYRLFGFTPTATLAQLTTVSVLAMVGMFRVARQNFDLCVSVLLTVLTALGLCGVWGQPWYDVTASFWILLGIYAVLPALSDAAPRLSTGTSLGVGVLVGLSLLSKHNIGLAGFLLFGVVILAVPDRLRGLVAYGGGIAGTLLVGIGSLASPADFLEQMTAYAPSDRLTDFNHLFAVFVFSPHGLLLILGLFIGWSSRADLSGPFARLLAVFLSLLLGSVFVTYTGSGNAIANITFLGPEMLLALLLIVRGHRGGPCPAWLLVLFLSPFLALAGYHTVNNTIWQPFARVATYPMRSAAIAGFRAVPMVGTAVDEAVEYVNAHVPKEDQLFVFPDATVIYGLTGHESYRGAPFIFHHEHFPPPGVLARKFHDRFVKEPPRWMLVHSQPQIQYFFVKPELIFNWLELLPLVNSDYERVWTGHGFALFRHR